MSELYITPNRYVSGFDIFKNLDKELVRFGKSALILFSGEVKDRKEELVENLVKRGFRVVEELMGEECTHTYTEKLSKKIEDNSLEMVVGIGGGKVMDSVKAIGFKSSVPIITVPTIAATCAAWSSHSAMYLESYEADEYYDIEKNPDLIFVDKKIIFEAPKRYILSGIADTLAKWIETSASTANIKEFAIDEEIAVYLAKKSYDDTLKYSEKAIKDIEGGVFSKEVDKIIDTIILTAGLVGGLGGEACRSVASHALNNGFTMLGKRYNVNLHGEVVGFGNVVQMILDQKDLKEIEEVVRFSKKLGIPISLKELKFDNLSDEELKKVVNRALSKDDTIWNLPYEVDFGILLEAIKEADELINQVL